jgi:sugar lactone lactonase YvrE
VRSIVGVGSARTASIPLKGIEAPSIIASDPEGGFWAAGGTTLLRYETDGSLGKKIALPTEISAIFRDKGSLLVATNQIVYQVDPQVGSYSELSRFGKDSMIVSIAVDAEAGRIYLADAGTARIWVCDGGGVVRSTIDGASDIGDASAGSKGFIIPSPYFPIAVAPDGTLRVGITGRHGVETYSRDGRLLSAYYRPGTGPDDFSGCCNPVCLLDLGDGTYATYEKGLSRLKIVDAQGRLVELLSDGTETGLSFVGTRAVLLSDGRIGLLDRDASRILLFERKGA